MWVRLMRRSPEGYETAMTEWEHVSEQVAECLDVQPKYFEEMEAGWLYWWDESELSPREVAVAERMHEERDMVGLNEEDDDGDRLPDGPWNRRK